VSGCLEFVQHDDRLEEDDEDAVEEEGEEQILVQNYPVHSQLPANKLRHSNVNQSKLPKTNFVWANF
jgi:hypothetical protein